MSIYLAASSPNPATTHAYFKQRGLDGLTHAPINQLGIHGRAFLREVAYDGYFRNIDVFLAATNRKVKIPTFDEDAELALERVPVLIPHEIPSLIYLPLKEFSPEQEESFMHKIRDYQPIKKVTGKTTTYILQHPDIRKAMTFLKSSKDGIIAPEGVWTPLMFASYSFLLVIITEFLKTNTYPAFISEDNRGDFDGGEVLLDKVAMDRLPSLKDEKVLKKMRMDDGISLFDDAEGDDDDADMDDNAYEMSFLTMRRAVLFAKPSPMPLEFNLGSPSEVPKLPGRVFPYFDRMNVPDNQTIRNIVSSFFLRNLGQTRNEQIGAFKIFRLGWERVARTPQGGILVHLLSGIRLALETQTRMFAVYRNQSYSGFVLLGAMWSVSVDNRTYDWGSTEDLQAEVAKMSSHEYAVGKICEVLSRCEVMVGSHEGPAVPITSKDVLSAKQMWEEIQKRKIEGDNEMAIKNVLGMVSYSRSYREISAHSLCWLFKSVNITDGSPITDDTPLYLSPTFSLYSDRLFQLLCTFGPDAPSLYNASGATYTIPKVPAGDPNNDVDGKGKKVLPVLLVSMKSVQVAYADLKKVLKDRVIKMDLAERAGKNRNVVIRFDGRDQVYEELRECLNLCEGTGAKRKGSILENPKAKMLDISTAEDLLNLF
jgi:hypothetical protein